MVSRILMRKGKSEDIYTKVLDYKLTLFVRFIAFLSS